MKHQYANPSTLFEQVRAALKNHNSSRKKCGKSSHLQKHRDFFLRTAGFSAS
jgi:hypothetical protein